MEWCNFLYLNGIIDAQRLLTTEGQQDWVCRYSSPIVQLRLYNAFSRDMTALHQKIPVVDPLDDLSEVFATLDLPALLGRYRDFLQRCKKKGQNPWQG